MIQTAKAFSWYWTRWNTHGVSTTLRPEICNSCSISPTIWADGEFYSDHTELASDLLAEAIEIALLAGYFDRQEVRDAYARRIK